MIICEAVQQMLAADQGGPGLGFEVDEAREGRAVVRTIVREEMTNGLGVNHGGLTFALADQAFACAANSVASGTATVEASISYLAPALPGDELVAHAEVIFTDGRRTLVDVELRVGERVVALFRGTGRTMRPPTG